MENETVEVSTTPSVSEEVKPTEPNTTTDTAAAEVVETKQVEPERTFTQAELDAAIQKRLLKEDRKVHRRVEQQQREQAEARAREVAPERDSYRDDDAYLQAQIEHLAERKAAEKLELRERQTQQERAAEAFHDKAEKAQAQYPDFQAVISNPTLTINEAMAEFITDSDSGAEIAYHLGKNPHRAADIAAMSPIKAARELTKLEAELAAKPKPQPSRAPAPISPIKAESGGSKSVEEMTDAEFAAYRRRQIAARS